MDYTFITLFPAYTQYTTLLVLFTCMVACSGTFGATMLMLMDSFNVQLPDWEYDTMDYELVGDYEEEPMVLIKQPRQLSVDEILERSKQARAEAEALLEELSQKYPAVEEPAVEESVDDRDTVVADSWGVLMEIEEYFDSLAPWDVPEPVNYQFEHRAVHAVM